MCHFLSLAVPERKAAEVESLRKQFHVETETRTAILGVFPHKTAVYEVTFGGCSCGLFIPERPATDIDRAAKDQEAYRRLGWSSAKIQRALEAKAIARSRPKPHDKRATQFAEAAAQLLLRTRQIWIFAHWNAGHNDVTVEGQIDRAISTFVASGGLLPENTRVTLIADTQKAPGAG